MRQPAAYKLTLKLVICHGPEATAFFKVPHYPVRHALATITVAHFFALHI